MIISSDHFEAYLNCPSKCWFRSHGVKTISNPYSLYVQRQKQTCRAEIIKRLLDNENKADTIASPSHPHALKRSKWRLITDFTARKEDLESRILGLERLFSKDKPDKYIPIRFALSNKIAKRDKTLLAFDALVLSEAFRLEITHGKIIHGHDYSKSKVKLSSLFREVRRIIGKIAEMHEGKSPPDIVLNRHCPECEFQAECRKKAVEKDDLSLLSGMKDKDRQKLNRKGIFTITQLSHTFRPRRRSKRMRDKPEKYHHSLKALAIRENKIHIVGKPEFVLEGTPIYMDVECDPDRNFYYLVGVLIKNSGSLVRHNLWADGRQDEVTIWKNLLDILSRIEKPLLMHYGSFESKYLKKMSKQYGGPPEGSALKKAINESINILTIIYAQIYFPVFGNGLKDNAGYIGYIWADSDLSGPQSIASRHLWEQTNELSIKEKLIRYNAQDCEALQLLTETVQSICNRDNQNATSSVDGKELVCLDSDQFVMKSKWQRFTSPVPSLEVINSAAHWNYQRDRIYVRTGEVKRIPQKQKPRQFAELKPELSIVWKGTRCCPQCGRSYYKKRPEKVKKLHEIMFGHRSIKLRLVKYIFPMRLCRKCGAIFGMPERYKFIKKYGWNLIAYFFYHVVDLGIAQRNFVRGFNRLYDFELNRSSLHNLKIRIATYYADTQKKILERITRGNLIHIDETRANIKGKTAFVWVLTSYTEVVYILSESREGEIAHKLLANFKGVLVSDFYTAYDSIDCSQQKCLIHLMRDMNDEVLNNPFDVQVKQMVVAFGDLLRPIIETVDKYGLKKYFLRKHLRRVDTFFGELDRSDYQSEVAIKCKERLDKNRDKLFTFLKFDGVPWNNNNAEHAIKAFARLRDVIAGTSTEKGIEEYLVLLSICQTCKYSGIDFLDYLRSGEKTLRVSRSPDRYAASLGVEVHNDRVAPVAT